MSHQQHPSPEERTQLETVTCWPLVLGALGLVGVAVVGVGGLALWNALRPRAEVVAQRVPSDAPAPVADQPTASLVQLEQPAAIEPEQEAPRQVKFIDGNVPSWRPSRAAEKPALPPSDRPAKGAHAPKGPPAVLPTKPVPPPSSHFLMNAAQGEEELRRSLWEASREIDLETEKGAGKALLDSGRKLMARRKAALAAKKAPAEPPPALTGPIRDLLDKRADLRGLPLVAEEACQSKPEAVKALAELGRQLQRPRLLAARERARPRPTPSSGSPLDGDPLANWLLTTREHHTKAPLNVGPLLQVFQAESRSARHLLTDTLRHVTGKESARALVGRAVFDLSLDVRRAAIDALKYRPAEDVRPFLLSGLDHPWPPAADHAALALVELDDQAAIPDLEQLLKAPDPARPAKEGAMWYVRELVRVNHLRNCLLCHAPSTDRRDPVRGPVPEPGRRLPEAYYDGFAVDPSVRADIVYFRQDFSVMHAVEKAHPWPAEQRFDYLVRKRELTKKEVETAGRENGASPAPSRQRLAARAALDELKRRKDGRREAN